MPLAVTATKPFTPGTTGWTAADLDDLEVEAAWLSGSYEIIEGVLTQMPPAYFTGGAVTLRLFRLLSAHLDSQGVAPEFATEVDIVLDDARVVKADLAYLTPDDFARQAEASRAAGKPDPLRARLYVPPTLVIESISPGHELHDERTKRRWYAEFRVPHYWLLNAFERTLRCLVLDNGAYREDAAGRDTDELRPSAFPGLVLPLANIWPE
jgi:Uma2 family endonuclease